ncbi:two-component system, OmpR family, phosphate regulon sensor histidine kinase PhoR [Anaerobranca californiensis DSM 14826]|uniref:histidine kinase n=1 Tax=Anaerobranca californiensis DSM 14826 TaxID=1120989 RepID=A0A1M6P6H4_9FIRM|nr:ATP-binding protein [Anaerobranca californiensis]SHK03534.1 two-component system, OmpR family, phosphate regulon sensor histidine kinase PhoR [Anaerobranca californiensis DSM 14826]
MASIKSKITITYTLLFLGIFTLLGIYLSSYFVNQYINTLEKDLINNTKMLSGFIRFLDREFLNSYAEDVSHTLGFRVTILDINGKPLAETAKPVEQLDNHLDRPEIQSALQGKITTSKRYSDTIKEEMLYSAAPIYNVQGEIIGFFRLAKSLKDIQKFIYNIRLVIFLSIVIGILLTWIFGSIIAHAFTENINKLIVKAREFGKGHFSSRVKVIAQDEIGELEAVFNEMGNNISLMMENNAKEKTRIENILRSLPIGVLIINKKGIVVTSNNAAREMLNIDLKGVNKPLTYLTRDYQVNDFVNNLLKGHEQQQLEVVLKNKNGEPQFIRLKGAGLYRGNSTIPDEIVVVLQDVTDLRRLEQVRKDLVANISHELRTPVTAIQGFAETLLEGDVDEETTKHFLNIIKDESYRLSRLINDILNLSKLESSQEKRKEGICNLKDTAVRVLSLFNEKITEKAIEVKMDIPEDLILAVDKDYVEQVLVNYVDNAIKYTYPKTKITISGVKQDNGFARIVVIDNGPGIPIKDQARVFERFFRVEKSRQRDVGGTGLGLAIVKHIVEGFKGEVGVRSIEKGTVFWATLPMCY